MTTTILLNSGIAIEAVDTVEEIKDKIRRVNNKTLNGIIKDSPNGKSDLISIDYINQESFISVTQIDSVVIQLNVHYIQAFFSTPNSGTHTEVETPVSLPEEQTEE